jgi:biotin-dependent carboxylase-like uncharacterized protein
MSADAAPSAEVRVVAPGLQTTIQDARGRPGLRRFGVPPGGAVDPAAASLADRLVGGVGDGAVLEITFGGPTLRWDHAAHIALAGADLGAVAAGIRLRPGTSYRLAAGTALAFHRDQARDGDPPAGGGRAYLAVQGGFLVPPVLGSASTDRRSGFGGLDGRALAAGDVLCYLADQAGPLRSAVDGIADAAPTERVHVVATPAALGWFGEGALTALTETTWTVTPDSDRTGLRLTGGRLEASTVGIASLGVPIGAVQVPPSGEPIVCLVDGPVTGGYPIVGVVARRDHGRLAQAGPGSSLRFALIEVPALRALPPPPEPRIELDAGDVAAAWAR